MRNSQFAILLSTLFLIAGTALDNFTFTVFAGIWVLIGIVNGYQESK